MAEPPLPALLDELGVEPGALVYVHSSADRLRRVGIGPGDALSALLERLGPNGTLTMPGFPFRGRAWDHVATAPVFSVRTSPVATGLIPFLLARRPCTRRSAHPIYPILAHGPLAEMLTRDHHVTDNPLDLASPFQRIIEHAGVLLGLGVSLNYNSFIHVLDFQLEAQLPFPYSDVVPAPLTVVDAAGVRHDVTCRLPRVEVVQGIKPSRAIAALNPGPEIFRFVDREGVYFFSLRLAPFCNQALELGRMEVAAGRRPPWLTDIH